MKNVFTLIFLLFISIQFSWGQHIHEDGTLRCGHQTHQDEHTQSFESWVHRKKADFAADENLNRTGNVLYVPVVFHIIHNNEAIGTGTNLSEALIQAQIDQINNDLRRNSGTSGYNSDSRGADAEIELKLALYDEDDNELDEPGINRVSAINLGYGTGALNKTFVNSTVKPATQWNPEEYLNIWVCNLSGILGFGQFPDISSSTLDGVTLNGTADTDGVCVVYKSIGSTEMPNPNATGAYANYAMGRTLTHELGHFFGLRHIWGDGNCSVDDYCDDTPISDGPNFGCPTTHQSCNTLDMVRNYMDYTYDSCMNVFTADQKNRMRIVLLNSPRRVELLSSDKATALPSLPVELVDFDARMISNQSASIQWSTLTELNNNLFTISRSTNGVDYEILHTTNGSSQSSIQIDYEFIDREVPYGTVYYKLIQEDLDGTTTELGIKAITNDLKGFSFNIFPNPAKNNIIIKTYSEISTNEPIKIYDALGRLVFESNIGIKSGENKISVSIEQLEAGLYFVQIQQKTIRLNKI